MEENRQNVPSFIGKLALMLQDQSAAPFVTWSPNGEALLIVDPSSFATQILPRYFKHSNFASFVRQLNLYGFHKTSQEPDVCEFAHPMFKQGNEHLFKDIRRKIATNNASEKEVLGRSKNDFDRTAVDKLFNDIHDLRSKHKKLEAVFMEKEEENKRIYSQMVESKVRQENLECRIGKMATVLDRACKTFSMRNAEEFHEIEIEFKAFKRQRHEGHAESHEAMNDQTDSLLQSLMDILNKNPNAGPNSVPNSPKLQDDANHPVLNRHGPREDVQVAKMDKNIRLPPIALALKNIVSSDTKGEQVGVPPLDKEALMGVQTLLLLARC
ncbi:hypothetical protein GUITHDRAFT_151863 [Guillardia theta CCMP2712]|uniref:HSF-type DNA-binding domain-containing protein n=2 Tax=Guillardia theta TaxID=55529 RepID=L1JJ69_GUITC|nr:hypothetical protein GUITHDRAFT_151863 [Guillardia theta CCMP2712]EKX48342.1 hypothetical protein GUITHDRAFT_151863 [Guillardia theta CCMP2712]|eukprot:XP_005835322.1 hypothetical protein GUITHDRAFT_151863 [Guillardia theta CCMP2712]